MKEVMATLAPCDCGEPATIGVPTHDRRTGRPYNKGYCLECHTEYDRDEVAELIAMLEEMHTDA